jgi:hypothetical protein
MMEPNPSRSKRREDKMGGEKFVPALKAPRYCPVVFLVELHYIRRGADKSLASPIFLFAAQPQEFFLDGIETLKE